MKNVWHYINYLVKPLLLGSTKFWPAFEHYYYSKLYAIFVWKKEIISNSEFINCGEKILYDLFHQYCLTSETLGFSPKRITDRHKECL